MMTEQEFPASKLNCLRLLREIHRGALDVRRVEDVLKSDLSLSYKLLKYINSAFFGLRAEVNTMATPSSAITAMCWSM